jgi:O-antigen ligase
MSGMAGPDLLLLLALILTAVILSAGTVVATAMSLAWSRWLVMCFVLIVMLFPESSSYGLVGGNASLVYVYGVNTLRFPLFDIALFGLWVAVVGFGRAWGRDRGTLSPLSLFYLGLFALFLGHALVGSIAYGQEVLEHFAYRGVINVFKQAMLVSLVFAVIRTPEQLRQMVWIMLVAIAGRELWGMVRYAALGGDPQNAYLLLERRNVKITFWDINDSVLAAFAIGFCAWRWLVDRVVGWKRYAFPAFALMAMLIAFLSARRTAQGGMALAMAMVLLLLPRGRRWPVALALAMLLPLALLKMVDRYPGRGPLLERLLADVQSSEYSSPRESRFYELRTAWQTIRNQPVFGVGPSGSFRADSPVGLEYHGGSYDFVHSGFGHILLKLGVVGLMLFTCLFGAYLWRFVLAWRHAPPPDRAALAASAAGMAAMLPTLAVGTPVIETRTMLVIGLLMVLPFAARRVNRQAATEPAPLVGKGSPTDMQGVV